MYHIGLNWLTSIALPCSRQLVLLLLDIIVALLCPSAGVGAQFVQYDSFMKVSLVTEAVELIVCKQGVSKWLSTRKWLII